MKRTILSLLVVGMFAGVGTSAMAQVNTTGAADLPAATTQGMTPESDSTTQKPAQSAANQTTPGHPALEGARGATAKPDDTAASETKPAHPALEGADRSASKPDTAAQDDDAQTQYQDAKAKCSELQGDAKRTCVAQARIAPNDALADADTQSDPVGEANAAGGAKSGNDGMGNSSGSPKYAQ